jgi:hypothetical protein
MTISSTRRPGRRRHRYSIDCWVHQVRGSDPLPMVWNGYGRIECITSLIWDMTLDVCLGAKVVLSFQIIVDRPIHLQESLDHVVCCGISGGHRTSAMASALKFVVLSRPRKIPILLYRVGGWSEIPLGMRPASRGAAIYLNLWLTPSQPNKSLSRCMRPDCLSSDETSRDIATPLSYMILVGRLSTWFT